MNSRQSQEGFTLIELMIVVAIVAILAAIAIPLYLNYTARAQSTGAINLAGGLKADLTEFYNSNGSFPTLSPANASIGAASPASITGKYVSQVLVNKGKIVATFCSPGSTNNGIACEANATMGGKMLTLSPITSAGSIAWKCFVSDPVIYKMVPAECRHSG